MFAEESIMHGWHITPIQIEAGRFHQQTEYIRSRRVKNIVVYVTNEEVLKEIVEEVHENYRQNVILILSPRHS